MRGSQFLVKVAMDYSEKDRLVRSGIGAAGGAVGLPIGLKILNKFGLIKNKPTKNTYLAASILGGLATGLSTYLSDDSSEAKKQWLLKQLED